MMVIMRMINYQKPIPNMNPLMFLNLIAFNYHCFITLITDKFPFYASCCRLHCIAKQQNGRKTIQKQLVFHSGILRRSCSSYFISDKLFVTSIHQEIFLAPFTLPLNSSLIHTGDNIHMEASEISGYISGDHCRSGTSGVHVIDTELKWEDLFLEDYFLAVWSSVRWYYCKNLIQTLVGIY